MSIVSSVSFVPHLYGGLHLYEEAVLGFPLPLRERDRVRGKAVTTNLLIQTKSAVARTDAAAGREWRHAQQQPRAGLAGGRRRGAWRRRKGRSGKQSTEGLDSANVFAHRGVA